VQLLLLALKRLQIVLPPLLLHRIIEQAISLAAPSSDVQKPCPMEVCQSFAPCQGCEVGLCQRCCRGAATGPPCLLHRSRLQ
jgi:hypothetical protein